MTARMTRSTFIITSLFLAGLAFCAAATEIPIHFNNSVTDYQPVITNAIANAEIDDILVFDEGVYIVNRTVKVDKKITLRGSLNGGTVIKAVSASDIYPVVNVSAGATLDHLAITGGLKTKDWGSTGMGVQMAEGTLSFCVITGNVYKAAGNAQGSGVYVNVPAYKTTTITHCRICDNKGSASLNTMPGVGAYVVGGGSSHFRMDNCLIANNLANTGKDSSAWLGAGICINTPDAIIANCTIVDNMTVNRGGGIGIGGNTPVIKNCIIANNRAGRDPCVYGPDISATTLTDGYIAASITNVCYNNLVSFGNVAFGKNGLAADPTFLSDSYYLKIGSPAIGYGIEIEGITDGVDLDGVQRDPASIDLGCFKYIPSAEFSMNVELGATFGFNDQQIPVTVSTYNDPAGKTLSFNYYITDGENDYPVASEDGKVIISRPGTWNIKVTALADNQPVATESSPTQVKIGVHKAYVTSNPNAVAVYPYATSGTAATCLNDITALCIDGTEIELDAGTHTVTGVCSFPWRVHVFGQGRDLTWINGNKKSVFNVDNADFLLENVSVTNFARAAGAAVFIGTAGGKVRNCRFADNYLPTTTAGSNAEGLTFYSTSANALVENCIFERIQYCRNDNMCDGIAIKFTDGKIRNCLFRDFICDDGKIYDYIVSIGSNAEIDNCTFMDNWIKYIAGRADNGIVYCIKGDGYIRNCLVCEPKPLNPDDPAPQYAYLTGQNGSKIKNCCFEGATTYGTNPADGTKINFSKGIPFDISASSSCRNSGMTCGWMTDSSTDLLGRPRIFGKAPDIGCCETQSQPSLRVLYY